jgi:ribose transport system permease protein
MSRKSGVNLGLDRFSGLYLWVVFIVVFGIWAPSTFLTASTLHSLAAQQAIAGMIALAVLIPLAAGAYDLSVGANANLTGIVAIELQTQLHWGWLPAVLASVAVGLAIGAVNALIVVRLGVSSFIATLGMTSVLAAILIIVTGNAQPQPVTSNAWNNLTQFQVGGFQIVVLYLLILGLVVWWFLDFTPAGRYIYACGANPDAARLSGVRVNRWTSVSLIAAGGIAGLAGVFFTSLTGPALSFGATLLLPAFAAAFLGSTQLQPGKFNVWGTLIAIYVLATGVEGLQLVTSVQWLSSMFDGVALILAVALAVSRQHRAATGRRKVRVPVTAEGETESLDGRSPVYAERHEGLTALEEYEDDGGLSEAP